MDSRDLRNEARRIEQEKERQEKGIYTPLEKLEKESKEQAISFYKTQKELVGEQKKYGGNNKVGYDCYCVCDSHNGYCNYGAMYSYV